MWVGDCWHENYSGAAIVGSAWTSVGNCSKRALRGGSYVDAPYGLHSAYRGRDDASEGYNFVGFRIARTLSQ